MVDFLLQVKMRFIMPTYEGYNALNKVNLLTLTYEMTVLKKVK